MSEQRRARLPWVLWTVAIVLLVMSTLALSTRNGSIAEDPLFLTIAVLMVLGYDTVGALVASRNPSNPIGWLMMIVPLGFLASGLATEYAKYAYLTVPGGLPFRVVAAWISGWVGVVTVTPIPIILTLFPNGRVPSRRWRFLPPVTVACGVAVAAGAVLNPGILDVTQGVIVQNPTAVPTLEPVAHAALWVGGLGLSRWRSPRSSPSSPGSGVPEGRSGSRSGGCSTWPSSAARCCSSRCSRGSAWDRTRPDS